MTAGGRSLFEAARLDVTVPVRRDLIERRVLSSRAAKRVEGSRLRRIEEILAQVSPLRIQRLHQRVLFLAPPAFELFLACYCVARFLIAFVIDEAVEVVTLYKGVALGVAVEPESPLQAFVMPM